MLAILMRDILILTKVKELGTFDEEYQKLFQLVQNGDIKKLDQECLASGDCLYFKDRLCIPKNQDLKKTIYYEAHDSPTTSHPWYTKTLNVMRQSYHYKYFAMSKVA